MQVQLRSTPDAMQHSTLYTKERAELQGTRTLVNPGYQSRTVYMQTRDHSEGIVEEGCGFYSVLVPC